MDIQKRKIALRPKLLLLIGSLFISLLLAEGAGRIYFNVKNKTKDPRDYLASLNTFTGRDYHHPDNNSSKIVVVGDSVSWGWAVNFFETYPRIIEGFLNTASLDGSHHHEVINLSRPGYNTKQSIDTLKEYLASNPNTRPGIIILSHYYNDAYATGASSHPDIEPDQKEKMFIWMKAQPYSMFLKFVALKIYQNDHRARGVALTYRDDFRGFQDMRASYLEVKAIAQAMGAKVIVPILPSPSARRGIYLKLMRDIESKVGELSRTLNFVPVPMVDVYLKHDFDSIAISKADEHPNRSGHLIIAKQVMKTMFENELVPNSGFLQQQLSTLKVDKNPIQLEEVSFPKGFIQNGVLHQFNTGGIINREFAYYEICATDNQPFATPLNETLEHSYLQQIFYQPNKRLYEDAYQRGKWDYVGTSIGVMSDKMTSLHYKVEQYGEKFSQGSFEIYFRSYEPGGVLTISQTCGETNAWQPLFSYEHTGERQWKESHKRLALSPCAGDFHLRISGKTPAANDWVAIRSLALKLSYPQRPGARIVKHTMALSPENAAYFHKNNSDKVAAKNITSANDLRSTPR